MLKQLEGIVIKTQDYGETHKIVTLFTKEIGKLSAISRGANRPKSRLSSISQPFIHGDYLIYVTKGLSTLQQGAVNHSFRKIREDIEKTAYGAYIMELTDKIMQDKEPDYYLYEELFQTLSWINDEEEYDIPVMMYELKMYQKAGICPVLDHCVNCLKRDVPYVFSVQEGGFLCEECRIIDKHAYVIGSALMRILPLLVRANLKQVGTISVKKKNVQILRMILDEYYEHYGGYTLKSKKFLDQLNLLK